MKNSYQLLTIDLGGSFLVEDKIKDKPGITDVAEKELSLLGRHLDILRTVKDHGPIGIIRLSKLTNQPQHMIRYSLRTLEQDGVIAPSPSGAVVTDKIHETLGTLESTLNEFTTKVNELKKKLK
jgi:predicted transcriptional regulator